MLGELPPLLPPSTGSFLPWQIKNSGYIMAFLSSFLFGGGGPSHEHSMAKPSTANLPSCARFGLESQHYSRGGPTVSRQISCLFWLLFIVVVLPTRGLRRPITDKF